MREHAALPRTTLLAWAILVSGATGACYASSDAAADGADSGETDDGGLVDGDVRREEGGVDDAAPDDVGADRPEAPEGMVYVAAGPFLMGSDDSDCPWDAPMHEVWLSSYFIDVLEVCNGDYEECVRAGACDPPIYAESLTRPIYFGAAEFSAFPVIQLPTGWRGAGAFCHWLGKRVPTEAEWEKAARGGCELRGDPDLCEPGLDDPLWPWGNRDPSCEDGNVFRTCFGSDTAPVGAFSRDLGPYGTLDMVGNVRELVEDWFMPDYYERSPARNPVGPSESEATGSCLGVEGACHVARGGSFGGDPGSPPGLGDALPCRRGSAYPSPDTGFRCAADAPW